MITKLDIKLIDEVNKLAEDIVMDYTNKVSIVVKINKSKIVSEGLQFILAAKVMARNEECGREVCAIIAARP